MTLIFAIRGSPLRLQRAAHVKLASTICICLENHRFRTTCVLIDDEKTFSPGNSCRAEASSGHGSRRRIAEENLRNDRHKRYDAPPLARLEARLLGESDGDYDRERAPEGDSGDAAPSGLRTPGTLGLRFRFEFAGLTWIRESIVSLSANWRVKTAHTKRRRRPINHKARAQVRAPCGGMAIAAATFRNEDGRDIGVHDSALAKERTQWNRL
jgi:hypothetical protein